MNSIQRLRASLGDTTLLLLVLGLSLFGVAMVYSAGQLDVPDPAVQGVWKKQLLFLGISIVVFLIVTRIQVRWLEWAAYAAKTADYYLRRKYGMPTDTVQTLMEHYRAGRPARWAQAQ